MDACEDDLVVTPHFACVVDGATSPTGRRWTTDQLTGGQWAARILCRAVKHDLTPEMTCREIVSTLTSSLYRSYEKEPGALDTMKECPEERATASFVLYSKYLGKLIFVGDCQAAFLDGNGKMTSHISPEKHCDTIISQARAMFWQAELLGRKRIPKGDPGRDLIHPLLLRQRRFQNNMHASPLYRYWAMDGFFIEEEGIQVHNVPESTREIILASDGYPKLCTTLKETEAHLHELIRKDPRMISDFLSAKGVREGAESFDDRTYLRIRINNDIED